MSELMIQNKKDVFRVERGIQVDGHSSMLIVECIFNIGKATYTISSKLTTKQIHPIELAINKATLAIKMEMELYIIEEAEKRRMEILAEQRDSEKDPNQTEMFGKKVDDTLPWDDGEADGSFTDPSPEQTASMSPLVLSDDMSASDKRQAKFDYVAEWMEKNPTVTGAREIARQINDKAINNQYVGRVIKKLQEQAGADVETEQ